MVLAPVDLAEIVEHRQHGRRGHVGIGEPRAGQPVAGTGEPVGVFEVLADVGARGAYDSALTRYQSISRRISARSNESSANSRLSRLNTPRVSSTYSAITAAPTTGTSPSASSTGSVPAGLSARNSLRRTHGFSSISASSSPYSAKERRTNRQPAKSGK